MSAESPIPRPAALTPFNLPDVLRFEPGEGGLMRAVITHPAASGEMYLHGGHVTAWQPRDADPVLFMSRKSLFEQDQPIRGGVPVCFPWFGTHAEDANAPKHGLARLQPWTITHTSSDEAGVIVEMAADVSPFRVTHRVTFGQSLRMTLRVENTGASPARFEEALHTYLRVDDVRQARITGLEGVAYLDTVGGGRRPMRQGNEPITFTGETDRIYLATPHTCLLHDPAMRRIIRVAKERSDTTVVWNPWIDKAARMSDFADDEWLEMVCIETCNVADHAISLAPGQQHEMSAILTIEPMTG